jgi:hypothetical protein
MTYYDTRDEQPERDREAEAARARAAIRPKKLRRCEVCGTRKEMASNGRYCSQVCRNRAYRERHQARTPLARHQARTPLALCKGIAEAMDEKRYDKARSLLQTLITMLENI